MSKKPKNLGDEMALMHMAGLAELGIIPPICPWCKGTGSEADYVGLEMKCVEVECGWCHGTGNAPQATDKRAET